MAGRDPAHATGESPALALPPLDAVGGDLKEEILVPPEPGGGSAPIRRERRENRRGDDDQQDGQPVQREAVASKPVRAASTPASPSR